MVCLRVVRYYLCFNLDSGSSPLSSPVRAPRVFASSVILFRFFFWSLVYSGCLSVRVLHCIADSLFFRFLLSDFFRRKNSLSFIRPSVRVLRPFPPRPSRRSARGRCSRLISPALIRICPVSSRSFHEILWLASCRTQVGVIAAKTRYTSPPFVRTLSVAWRVTVMCVCIAHHTPQGKPAKRGKEIVTSFALPSPFPRRRGARRKKNSEA